MTLNQMNENNESGESETFLSVSSWREEKTLFLSLDGEVDMYTVAKLKEAITDGLKDGVCTTILADMSQTSFVDSTGYGAFIGAMQTLRLRDGGRVHLARCQPAVNRMLTVARLHHVFVIHDSLEQARESLSLKPNPDRSV